MTNEIYDLNCHGKVLKMYRLDTARSSQLEPDLAVSLHLKGFKGYRFKDRVTHILNYHRLHFTFDWELRTCVQYIDVGVYNPNDGCVSRLDICEVDNIYRDDKQPLSRPQVPVHHGEWGVHCGAVQRPVCPETFQSGSGQKSVWPGGAFHQLRIQLLPAGPRYPNICLEPHEKYEK